MSDIQQDIDNAVALCEKSEEERIEWYNASACIATVTGHKKDLIALLSEIEPEYISDFIDTLVTLSAKYHHPEITALLLDYKYKHNLFKKKELELL